MAEKKSKNKKVLAASVILAAMIVASSSFAWFTSQDEVVNKLSAKNEYAVTVTENFTPPPQWLPGQTVDKQAGAINTGNIDAFVKLTLSNQLVLTTYGTPQPIEKDEEGNFTPSTNGVTLDEVKGEVKSLQAGGRLVWKNGEEISTADKEAGTGFIPTTTGLYIFDRNDSTELENYAGYYFVKGEDSNPDKYYSLAKITHISAAESTPESFSATIQTIAEPTTVKPTLEYNAAQNMVVATYGEGEQQIKINIHLANDHATNWTQKTVDEYNQEFYYNKILVKGEETGNLVTSVELDSTVKNAAYRSMDYNLKVKATSVQVTKDDITTAVKSEWGLTDEVVSVSGNNVTWNFTTTP